jgi:hypothetical protein
MYKYSKGINLVAGGEKHRVYVKKSPTGVGKGVKGHVMVNHPTEDKGKWDTIDLTEKAGAKTVEDGKNATKKWHAENPYVSGAKSVKQYRGDENLPEAKNGMKKCGCKHPKTKYKLGTGALTIPEGSAIVTANGGKNKQALMAYKKGNYKLLNKIIDDMPEDNVDKAQAGKRKVKKIAGKKSDNFQEEFVIGDPRYGRELSEKNIEELYALSDAELDKSKKFSPFTKTQEKAKRAAARNKQETFTFTYKGKTYSGSDNKGYASGYKIPQEETKTGENKTIPKTTETPTPISPPTQTFAENKRKGNFLSNIPSLAEITARASILGRGIENVPENYLTLGRYRYESQLPKTLREIQLAEQAGRETSRDIVAGDAGRYLAQAGNLSAARMKAANEAVIQDTLARQDILNKNVDLGNVESQTNRGLKDQYAQQRAMGRAAYDAQLVSLGQRIDSATETAQEMSNQRNVDDIRTNLLKSKDYYMDPQGNIRMGKNGLKRVKAYKRR